MDARVDAAIGIMRLKIANRPTIRSLATAVHLSPSSLRRLFNSETGRSPIKHLKELRMQNAEQLLQDTVLSVKEIAFLCGMNDVSHFVRDFKKEHGMRPSQFRLHVLSSRTVHDWIHEMSETDNRSALALIGSHRHW